MRSTCEPVLDHAEIMGLRDVCHQVLVAPARAGSRHQPGDGHAAGRRRDMSWRTKFIRYGSSPRGAQALVECGRVLRSLEGPPASFDRRCRCRGPRRAPAPHHP